MSKKQTGEIYVIEIAYDSQGYECSDVIGVSTSEAEAIALGKTLSAGARVTRFYLDGEVNYNSYGTRVWEWKYPK